MTNDELTIKTNILLEEARKYHIDIYHQMDYIHSSNYPADIILEALRQLIDSQIEREV